MDVQGSRTTTSRDSALIYVEKIKNVAQLLDRVDAGAPQYNFIKKLALALRIHASLIRSCGNFAEAQRIRENNETKLSGAIHRPDKEPTWAGDKDFIKFTEVMRDELDNAQELESLLQHGGMELMCVSKDARHEDTFLLGPDLMTQIKKKRKIMLDHWLDIQDYLASPFK